MYWFHVKMVVHDLVENLAVKIAWAMPRRVVYWCAIRLMSAATIASGHDHSPSEMKIVDALKAWEKG